MTQTNATNGAESEPGWEARALAAMRTMLEAYDRGDASGINETLALMQSLVAEKDE